MISNILRLGLPVSSGQATPTASAPYTKVAGVMCSLRMRPLADADPQNF